jgi:oleandomycin transport system ATP-binding protein
VTIAIQAEGLVKKFGKTTALAGVDLSAAAGTVLGVLGPNGAGKTTAVRILTTLLQPDAGHAEVGGYDVVRDAHRVRQLTGLTGQYASVDEGLSGTNNLIMIGRLLGLSRAAARSRSAELLTRFDLSEAAGRPVKTYSAACAAGSTWPRAWSAGHRCCSWTSRQPVLTRRPGRTSGRWSGRWCRTG